MHSANLNASGFRVYFYALQCALRLIFSGRLAEGLKLMLSPVGYWRFLPFAFVANAASGRKNAAILDVSSPKMVSVYLAANGAQKVLATDLDDPRIFNRWEPIGRVMNLANYRVEYQDARNLTYAPGSFDIVYTISVIEHIPGRGDAEAMEQFARVLKPGGVLIVEVPYRREGSENYRMTDSKGAPVEKPMFYERHYDAKMLAERLLDIPGLKLTEKYILGENVNLDRWISGTQLPRLLRIVFLPFEPFLAAMNYWARTDDAKGHPLAALMIYVK
jgi:SAM-dependent methyltransferase